MIGIETILFGIIAVVVLISLYNVLGQRGHGPHGDKDEYDYPRPEEIFEDTSSDSALDGSGNEDILLADITKCMPSFTRERFLSGAEHAYRLISQAFFEGDLKTLRPLVSDKVFSAFKGLIGGRTGTKGKKQYEDFASVETKLVISMSFIEGNIIHLCVQFISCMASSDMVREEEWVFSHYADSSVPWVLSKTCGANQH